MNPMSQASNANNMSALLLNPMIRRISKISEKDGTAVTYKGVINKTVFFLGMVLVGAIVALFLHTIPFDGVTDDGGNFISYIEFGALIVGGIFMVVCPFLAIFIRSTTPVTGSLSCIGNGIILGTVSIFLSEYRGAMLMAFFLTLAITAVLLWVYFSGKIQVTKKFQVFITTLFGTMVVGSLIILAASFTPACKDMLNFIQNNVWLSVALSLGGIVIAMLFLVWDFDSVHNAVENQLPAKYEWTCAYALAFTVIWLYFKVFDLFVSAQKATRSN